MSTKHIHFAAALAVAALVAAACSDALTDPGALRADDGAVQCLTNCLPQGDDGSTPGYWKNHLDSWAITGYSPWQTVDTVFGDVYVFPTLASATLHQALSFGGGPGAPGAAKILLRAAVAALLNASHPGVPALGSGDVVAWVNAALVTQDRDTILALATTLDNANNGSCPLS